MNNIENFLRQRLNKISVEIPLSVSPASWLEDELLNNPYALSTIKTISYQAYNTLNRSKIINLSVDYLVDRNDTYVFAVKDVFELITVISLSLKQHLESTTIVIDNRKSFVSKNGISELIKSCREYVGEELQLHQFSFSSSKWRSFFNNRIIVYTMEMKYFDSEKDINDLSCILAEQAKIIRYQCKNNPRLMINSILKWFRENIEYKNTNRLEDHSAVGLYKNKTAVCQGIAAYAYLLLTFCGIKARYVSGEGKSCDGWGPHGWNMVLLNGTWYHIDYTFKLNDFSNTVIEPFLKFKIDHRWDESKYNKQKSDSITNTRVSLEKSLIILMPNKLCFSVNGCVVDTTKTYKICYTNGNNIFVAIIDIIKFSGGSCCLKGNKLFVYIGVSVFFIALEKMIYKDGAWYINVMLLKSLNYNVLVEGQTIVLKIG